MISLDKRPHNGLSDYLDAAGFAFACRSGGGTGVHGDILCEGLKSLDCQSRKWKFLEPCPDDLFQKVLTIVDAIMGE